MKLLNAKKELNYLRVLFFLFGLGIMSWVPRYPEVKAGLKLDNGAFGSLISTGAIGSLISLLAVGHIVHKIGVKKVLQVSAFLLMATLIILSHTNSVPLFFVTNIIFLGSISAFHISINAQGFNYQDRTSKFVITQLSGLWSAGALVTAFIAGFLVDHVSLAVHITVLVVVIFIANIFLIGRLSPELIKANQDANIEYRLRDLLKGF